ncbi:hypothetical protein T484DRAFT_1911155, partial [Baffinella frigidus]
RNKSGPRQLRSGRRRGWRRSTSWKPPCVTLRGALPLCLRRRARNATPALGTARSAGGGAGRTSFKGTKKRLQFLGGVTLQAAG